MRNRIAILGSTGSIGRQTLDVVRAHPEHFEIVGLAARRDSLLLAAQAAEFSPLAVCLTSGAADAVMSATAGRFRRSKVLRGDDGLLQLATLPEADIVLVATPGTVSRAAALAALESGKDVALANKESLVTAGSMMTAAAARTGARILPVDSEHSAIWQCVVGEARTAIRRLILTASGGPFRTWSAAAMESVTPSQALAHPTWLMGPKVTVDSATLLNKGLEAIEAHWLFDVPFDQIEVVIHPESIVHSLVEFIDGSLKAQLGWPNMRLPIQYALAYPDRLPLVPHGTEERRFDLASIGSLRFERPDLSRFPCLPLALEAGRQGGTAPAVLAAAGEVAVEQFLEHEIGFGSIAEVIETALQRHIPTTIEDLHHLDDVEFWARSTANAVVQVIRRGTRQPAALAAGALPTPPRFREE